MYKYPSDIDAEIAILNSMIFDKEALLKSEENLTEDDFYLENNKIIFKSLISLLNSKIEVDIITLNNNLKENGVLEKIGGKETIITIAESFYTSSNIDYHIKIVKEKSLARKLIKSSEILIKKIKEEKENIFDILEETEKTIFNIFKNKKTDDYYLLKDILMDKIESLENIYKDPKKIKGLETGFIDLDKITSGLQKSDLIVIGARPSMGKTAFMLNIAQNIAKNEVPIAFFSLEMSKEQIADRLISSSGFINSDKFKNVNFEDEDWLKTADAISYLAKQNFYMNDKAGIKINEIKNICRKLKLEKNIELVVIDYLQLISNNSKKENRQQELAEISRELKILAKDLEITIITATQLSRACEQRQNKRPMLSDIRESGAIEQDADIVMFLYRDEYYNPDTEIKGITELIIGKHRNGQTGTIQLNFLNQYTKFVNLSK